MSDKYKDLEGSVPVDGNITPTTRQPIAQLDSSEWDNMTVSELVDQRVALYNRITLAQSMGQDQYVPAMQRGLVYLDNLLKIKGADQETKLI